MKFIRCMVKMIIFFDPYKNHSVDFNGVLEIIKNVDLNALSSSLQSIEKY